MCKHHISSRFILRGRDNWCRKACAKYKFYRKRIRRHSGNIFLAKQERLGQNHRCYLTLCWDKTTYLSSISPIASTLDHWDFSFCKMPRFALWMMQYRLSTMENRKCNKRRKRRWVDERSHMTMFCPNLTHLHCKLVTTIKDPIKRRTKRYGRKTAMGGKITGSCEITDWALIWLRPRQKRIRKKNLLNNFARASAWNKDKSNGSYKW